MLTGLLRLRVSKSFIHLSTDLKMLCRRRAALKLKKGSSKASERITKGKKTNFQEEQVAAPLFHKRKRSSPVKKTLTSTTARIDKLVA